MNDLTSEELDQYRTEFEKLGHRNIPFSVFVAKQAKERKLQNYSPNWFKQNVKVSSVADYKYDISDCPSQSAVRRTIVLDGPNIMHGGSIDKDERSKDRHDKIPDVTALLAVIRFFAKQDFDVMTVISTKYFVANTTNYKTAIDTLVEEGMLIVAHHSNLDDHLALEIASAVNGVVVSTDNFNDHATDCKRFKNMVRMNTLNLQWEGLPSEHRRTATRNGEHYVANKKFKFTLGPNDLHNGDVLKILYCEEEDEKYHLTVDRRKRNWSVKNRNKMLSVIDQLIVDAPAICTSNVERILQEDVHIPRTNEQEQEEDEDGDDEW